MDKSITTQFTIYEDELRKLVVGYIKETKGVEIDPNNVSLLCNVDQEGNQYAFAATATHSTHSFIQQVNND